ncbi:MAG: exodeoxyribonuclease VII small subunit [Pseudomonadota bacterium]
MAAKKSAQPDLESALAELEALVKTMESGDLSLDEAMKNFERGVELTRFCQSALKDAEQKVDILMQDSKGEKSLEDFS